MIGRYLDDDDYKEDERPIGRPVHDDDANWYDDYKPIGRPIHDEDSTIE